ncbi:unnamed protein product [Rhodiola kirilowii]
MAADDDSRRRWFTPNDGTSSTNLNTRIMIIAIISLSSVILLVLTLHIYARCVLARRVNRRRSAAIRRLALSQYSQSQPGQPQSTTAPKPGLSPAVVAALPTFKFKNLPPPQADKTIDQQRTECSVCLSLLEEEEMVRQLPNCKHAFHVECIDKWLEFNTSCPLCRAEAEPAALEPSAPPVDIDNTSGQQLAPAAAVEKGGPASVASTSRLSSFRRMLSRDRSSRRVQPSAPEVEITHDVERQ